jgi:hypothetical protein
MRTALGARHGMDLVDDHGLDPRQHGAGLGGHQQEQRLGCGDEDVGRVSDQATSLVGRGVARAHPDTDVRRRQARTCGLAPDPGQGGAQVALDVDREGLERRDVQHPAALVRGRVGRESVQGPQERRQGLAGAGGGDHEGVVAPGDRLPGADLRLRGSAEGAVEPGPGGGRELLQRHGAILHRPTDTCP